MCKRTHVCFAVPPRNLVIDIQKDTAVEGEEIEVNCTAMASKPATTIRWFKGNTELKGEVPPGPRGGFRLGKREGNATHAPEQRHSSRCGLPSRTTRVGVKHNRVFLFQLVSSFCGLRVYGGGCHCELELLLELPQGSGCPCCSLRSPCFYPTTQGGQNSKSSRYPFKKCMSAFTM